MKVGKYFMIVSVVMCAWLSLLLSGCDGGGGAAIILPGEKPVLETQQVACDTVEVSRDIQYYPMSSKEGRAVSLEKTAPKMIKENTPFKYILKVTNLTNSDITNVIVADKVPVNMVFVDSEVPMERVSEEMVQWKIGTLSPNISMMIETKAIATGTGSIMSYAEVSYDRPVFAEMKILKTELNFTKVAPIEVMSCDRIELKYMVINSGTATACDIVIKETLPEGLMTAEGKDSFEFTVDKLVPGDSCEFSKMVDSIKRGKYASKATLSSSSIELLESNVVEINVIEPVLTLKQSTPEKNSVGLGRIFEYVLTNEGPAIASNAMIVAMLPPDVVLTSASDNGKIYETDSRLVSWKIGDLKPNMSKKVTMVLNAETDIAINPQAVAKANCAHAVSAIRLPSLKELTSVSVYKPFVPE